MTQEQVIKQGERAWLDGLTLAHNPYRKGQPAFYWWQSGYNERKRQDRNNP